jgi:predicted Zn-dependent protease
MLKWLVIGCLLLFLFSRLLPRIGALLGVHARKPFRQARWMWTWATASESDALQAEAEYGRECAREFAGQFPDPAAASHRRAVAETGARLASASKDAGRQWHFEAVRSSVINAYALPGGYIYVTDSLLDLGAGDPDHAAFILAHEMTHVLKGHARERLAAGVFLNAVASRLAGAGRMIRDMLGQGYSRDMEFEADREGALLAKSAGFDGGGAVRALQRLAAVSPDYPGLAEYLSSHPPITERIHALERL